MAPGPPSRIVSKGGWGSTIPAHQVTRSDRVKNPGFPSDREEMWLVLVCRRQKHMGNVAYGVAKAATDKLSRDMAEELRVHGVVALSED